MAFDVTDFLAEGTRQCLALAKRPLPDLLAEAEEIRQRGHGRIVSYSRKVFIPLTQLCRDSCAYCTFAKPPRRGRAPYMSLEEVLALPRAAPRRAARRRCSRSATSRNCVTRRRARHWRALGHDDDARLPAAMAAAGAQARPACCRTSTPGMMSAAEIAALRKVSVSQGMMLEIESPRLCEKGGPHYGSPDKHPRARLATIEAAGEARGAVHDRHPHRHRRDAARTDRLAAGDRATCTERTATSRKSSSRISAPRPTPGWRTRRAGAGRSCCGRSRRARLIFGPQMNIQAPPNLSSGRARRSVAAGINDWGGVSPVTPDHVNPEAPWPAHRRARARHREPRQVSWSSGSRSIPPTRASRRAGSAPALHTAVCAAIDTEGFAREENGSPGADAPVPSTPAPIIAPRPRSARPGARPRRRRQSAGRGRDRPAVRGARSGVRRRLRQPPTNCAQKTNGDTVQLCRQPQHQLHQRLLFPLPLLRLLEGQDPAKSCAAGPTISTLDEIARRVRRSVGARRDRSVHAGRHPPATIPARPISRSAARGEGGAAAASTSTPSRRSKCRRARARSASHVGDFLARLQGRGPRHAAGHRGGNPRRRGAARALPGQDQHCANG